MNLRARTKKSHVCGFNAHNETHRVKASASHKVHCSSCHGTHRLIAQEMDRRHSWRRVCDVIVPPASSERASRLAGFLDFAREQRWPAKRHARQHLAVCMPCIHRHDGGKELRLNSCCLQWACSHVQECFKRNIMLEREWNRRQGKF